jgi:hypothetical protein
MTTTKQVVTRILSDISSKESEHVERGLLTAFFVLEQSRRYKAAGHQDDAPAMSADTLEWLAGLRSEYKVYSDLGGLPAEYLGVVLGQDQIDTIVGSLSLKLERQDAIARNAIAAIAVSGRPWVVPRLARFVRDYAQHDSPSARDAIHAIGKILRENGIWPGAGVTAEEDQILSEAIDALRFAAASGAQGPLRAREQAQLELASITKSS